MSADYRDELSAVHSRIAELEDKVRALEVEQKEPEIHPLAGRFPELEASVARLRRAADVPAQTRRLLITQFAALPFPILGAYLSFQHLPLLASLMSIVFIAITAAMFVLRARFKTTTRALAEAEQKLGDARRMHELETRLAATEAAAARVRIGAEPEGIPREEDEAEDANANDAGGARVR